MSRKYVPHRLWGGNHRSPQSTATSLRSKSRLQQAPSLFFTLDPSYPPCRQMSGRHHYLGFRKCADLPIHYLLCEDSNPKFLGSEESVSKQGRTSTGQCKRPWISFWWQALPFLWYLTKEFFIDCICCQIKCLYGALDPSVLFGVVFQTTNLSKV